jgi:hypothetical protein
MKILVLGGRGFLGREIVRVLRLDLENDVWVGSHSASGAKIIPTNWKDKGLLEKVVPFDIIINATSFPADDIYLAFIKALLSAGRIFIETTADPASIRKLLAWQWKPPERASAGDSHGGSSHGGGLFIHGMGIFPGLSNLFYKHYLLQRTETQQVRFGVRYTILSGAGKGMCELMAKTILEPSAWIEDHLERTGPPIGPAYSMQWQESFSEGVGVFLPDLLYIQQFYNSPTIGTYLSIQPEWISKLSPLFNKLPKTKWSAGCLKNGFTSCGASYSAKGGPACVCPCGWMKSLFIPYMSAMLSEVQLISLQPAWKGCSLTGARSQPAGNRWIPVFS